MGNFFAKRSNIFFSILLLVLGEGIIYTLLEKSLFSFDFSKDYLGYLVVAELFIFLFYSFYLFLRKTLLKEEIFRLILPFLLNLSFILFCYFSLSFQASQIALFLTIVLNLSLFLEIENKKPNPLKNIALFFTVFLFFFSAYNFFYSLYFPYWLLIILINLFLIILLYYKLKLFKINKNILFLLLVIPAILFSEASLFSFFIPIKSFFIKSLFLVSTYYVYWAIVEAYLSEKPKLKYLLKNIITFILILVLITLYSYWKGDLK